MDWIITIDLVVNNFFQQFQNLDILMFLMKSISFLGKVETLVVFSLITIFLLLKKSKYESGVFIIAMSITASIVYIFKEFFQRIRPEGVIEATGFSFPSGHTALGLIFYGLIAYFSYKYLKDPVKKPVIVLSMALALFSGISRVFLGVHWLSDVFASFVISGIILTISILIIENRNNFKQN